MLVIVHSKIGIFRGVHSVNAVYFRDSFCVVVRQSERRQHTEIEQVMPVIIIIRRNLHYIACRTDAAEKSDSDSANQKNRQKAIPRLGYLAYRVLIYRLHFSSITIRYPLREWDCR